MDDISDQKALEEKIDEYKSILRVLAGFSANAMILKLYGKEGISRETHVSLQADYDNIKDTTSKKILSRYISTMEKHINKGSQESILDDDAMNVFKTMSELGNGVISSFDNVKKRSELILELSDLVEGKKISESESRFILKIVDYQAMAQYVAANYTDTDTYEYMRKKCKKMYNTVNKNAEDIMKKYIDMKFLNCRSHR